MTIQNLTQEIFEKSYNRESLERLLTKEIKKKVELALELITSDKSDKDIVKETLKSE